MKINLTHIIRILVAAVFIFSGYVKLVDPLGSAYKFQEYFSSDVLNMEFLIPYALPFSIFLILAEITLGVMLLVGSMSKFTVRSLFVLTFIFLFLTWYSAYFDKVRDCGCFGDALKLSAWNTFYKNVFLIILVVWLVRNVESIRPLYSKKLAGFISIISLIGFSVIVYRVLNHLPIHDYRAYAVGKNIPEQMIYPENAKQDVYEDTWLYKVDGEEKKFTTEEKPWDIEGAEYIDRKTKLIERGYEPPIHDFTMELEGYDLTKTLMQNEKLMLIVSYNLSKADTDGFANIKTVTDDAIENGYTVYLMTASSEDDFASIKEEFDLKFNMLFCDETTLKTIIRSSPGIVTINKGTIVGKWSYNDFEDVKIKQGMKRKTIALDFNLKESLDSIFLLDKKYRSIIDAETPQQRDSLMSVYNIPRDSLGTDFWSKQAQIDSSNIRFLDKVIKVKGYPGKSIVGELSKDAAWSVIMHSNRIPSFIEQVKEAAEKNELTYEKAAIMEDLYLMNKGEEQIYGSQTAYVNDKYVIWPIKEVESVNVRRKEAGFSKTVQEYAKELFGDDFTFEPIKLEDVK